MTILYLFIIILFVVMGLIGILILNYFYTDITNMVGKLLLIIIIVPTVVIFVYLLRESYVVGGKKNIDLKIDKLKIPLNEMIVFTDEDIILSLWEIKYHSKAPTIILSHSTKGNKLENLKLAKRLYKEGYNCVLFDFRAHGESKGKIVTFGHKERKDLKAVLTYVINDSFYKSKKIGLYGVSMGALVSILVGGDYKEVKAIIADSCYPNIQKLLENYAKINYNIPCWITEFPVRLAYLARFFKDPQSISVMDDLKEISEKAILFITSESKRGRMTEMTRVLYNQAGGPKKLWIVDKNVKSKDKFRKKDLYIGKVISFLNKYFPRGPVWEK